MKNSFMCFGVYAGIFLVVFNTLTWVIAKLTGNDSILNVVTGYAAIILCLCFVYFGIRWYRDKQNGGLLTFGQGLKTGMLIVLVPSFCFGLLDVLYITFINPHFYEKYIQHQEAVMKAAMPAAEFASKAPQMRAQMQFFSQPMVDFTLMFLTVACVGIVVTIISTLLLKRRATARQEL